MKYFLALAGLAKVGKTTAKKYIITTSKKHLLPVSFADEIKREVAEEAGLDLYRLFEDYDYKAEHRSSLIALGEQRRLEDPFYWVSKVSTRIFKYINSYDGVVIDDLGYTTEYMWAKGCGFHVCQIYRPGIEPSKTDERDTNLAGWLEKNCRTYDSLIKNDGSLEDFYSKLDIMFNRGLSKKLIKDLQDSKNPNFDAQGFLKY